MSKLKLCLQMISLISTGAPAVNAWAWVDLNEWKRPKVFGLAPSADTAQLSYTSQGRRGENAGPHMSKASASALALYPMTHTLVAGFNFGGSSSQVRNIPAGDVLNTLQARGSYFELAALYAFSDNLSLYFSPGVSSKRATLENTEIRENFVTLTSYGVWAVDDDVGLGIGVSGKRNERTQTLVPLLGGAWQPVPEFRLDGWLPAHVQARWKFAPAQSLFARVELAGESALAGNSQNAEKTEVQLLGGQLYAGYSIGTPIGFGSGFLRFDPAVGFFKGNLKQTNGTSKNSTATGTQWNPLIDAKIAVAF